MNFQNIQIGLLFCLASLGLITPQAALADFKFSGYLVTPRSVHTATLLQDGRVLLAGGTGRGFVFNQAELYDPSTKTWTNTGAMNVARYAAGATLLPDGRVLVVGGFDGINFTNTAEIYDPATGTWAFTGSPTQARGDIDLILLHNGKVLLAGGGLMDLFRAELYDPATGTWAPTGSLHNARAGGHKMTLLPSGDVLIAGGISYAGPSEIYHWRNGTWGNTGSMNGVRYRHTQIRLADGRVLVAGGEGTSGYEFPVATAEVYDPATGLWTSTHSLNEAREDHSASLLPDGTVMVAGGYAGNYSVLASAEIYDPSTGNWRRVPGRGLQLARSSHTATTLPGGRALIAGGDYNTALAVAAELYRSQ